MGNKLNPKKIEHEQSRELWMKIIETHGKSKKLEDPLKKIYSDLIKRPIQGVGLVLNFNGFEIGDYLISFIFEILIETGLPLYQINLAGNSLTKQSTAKVAEYLEKHHFLELLDLSNNPLGPSGIRNISLALIQDTKLTDLFINATDAGRDGAVVIADLIETNATLRNIEFRENSINLSDASFLAESLNDNKTLLSLDLTGNPCMNSIGPDIERIIYVTRRNSEVHDIVEGLVTNSVQRTFKARLRNFNKSIKGQEMAAGRARQEKERGGVNLKNLFADGEGLGNENTGEVKAALGRWRVGMAEMMGKRNTQEDVSMLKLDWLLDISSGEKKKPLIDSIWTVTENYLAFDSINIKLELSEDGDDEDERMAELKLLGTNELKRIPVDPIRSEFFGLFDGHGGREAAEHVANQLDDTIKRHLIDESQRLEEAITESFFELQNDMSSWCLYTGTTALVALVLGQLVWVANVGDSRAVLSREGRPLRVSKDQKPDDKDEEKRIIEAGGFVKDGRVNGILAVSRALGDGSLGSVIYPAPWISSFMITARDEFLIMACDGVWDVLSDEEAVQIVGNELNAKRAAKKLRDEAFNKGSTDNISVIVIFFK